MSAITFPAEGDLMIVTTQGLIPLQDLLAMAGFSALRLPKQEEERTPRPIIAGGTPISSAMYNTFVNEIASEDHPRKATGSSFQDSIHKGRLARLGAWMKARFPSWF